MDNFDFGGLPLPVRKHKQSWSAPLVIVLLAAVCVLLAITLSIVASRANQPQSTKTATVTGLMTKQEWKAKEYQIKQSHNKRGNYAMHSKELYAAFGKPCKTQSVDGYDYWYWKCSDGLIQVVLSTMIDPNDDTCRIISINEY